VEKLILSLFVENKAGMLGKVADLFGSVGYNIDSLSVGVTEDPLLSRMTIAIDGEQEMIAEIKNKLQTLDGVVKISELRQREAVLRELVLVRIQAEGEERHSVIVIADIFRAKIVTMAKDSVMLELTGPQAKLDAFMKLLEEFTILEFVRTGLTGLDRDMHNKMQ